MKTRYGTILVLVMVTAALSAAPLPCWAGEKEEENIWVEDEPRRRHGRFELTDERIERIMNRLSETDPEKAKELEQLREIDPEKFKTELRKAMRERFGRRFREHRERGFGPHGMPGKPGMPGRPGIHGRGGRLGEGGPFGPEGAIRRKLSEYLEWLKENYPEEAEKLAEVGEQDLELYRKALSLSYKKYGKIERAEKEHPELAAALKEDMELKQQRDGLLKAIETASGDQKQELISELEEVVSSRFDLIVKRKQIRYEQLRKKLERLKEQVEQSETEVEKWKDAEFKDDNVKARVGELLNQTEKIDWD